MPATPISPPKPRVPWYRVLYLQVLVAVALVLFADIVNPEAFIVRHNAERARTAATVDLGYLGSLSDDAMPQIAETFDRRINRTALRGAIHCRRWVDGVSQFNVSIDAAVEIRRTRCPH